MVLNGLLEVTDICLRNINSFEAMQILTARLYEKQEHDFPISTWRVLKDNTSLPIESKRVVKHIMRTDIFSVYETDSVELVLNIMRWKNIHHMPIINHEKELLGILSWSDMEDI